MIVADKGSNVYNETCVTQQIDLIPNHLGVYMSLHS